MAPRVAESFADAATSTSTESQPHPAAFGTLLEVSAAKAANLPFAEGLVGVNQVRNYLFANTQVILFMALLAGTLAFRWIHMGTSHLRLISTIGRPDQRFWMHNRSMYWAKIKKHLLYAPLGHNRHNRELQLSRAVGMGTLPGRFHTLLLVVYLASNLAYTLVLDYEKKNLSAVLAELRGRSGEIAVLNIIPTILFAIRNNPLIPLLGVSYECFNLLHRWAARIVVIEAALHTVVWAINCLRAGGMHEVHVSLTTSPGFIWGMVATAVLGFLIITAAAPIRHAFYEIFLNLHRVMVGLVLAGIYIHLQRAALPQVPYIQLCIAIWGCEYVWRFGRICYFNISRRKGITKITVEALPADACRVTFDLVRPWHYTPGCHVHAYLPALALWSSHPFSVAWAEERSAGPPLELDMEKSPSAMSSRAVSEIIAVSKRPPMVSRFSKATLETLEMGQKTKLPNPSVPRDAKVTSVSLVMRARSGMTKKLYDKASACPAGTFTTWGAIEGPYGGHETFASYGTVILFAGGVGITHCVGYVQHLLTQYQAGTCSTQRILLVWSVPNTEALEWVRIWMDQILRMEGRRDILRIQLFVTKPRHRGEVISNTGSVQMFPGRCNPTTILEKEMQDRIGAVGVTVCGPGAFADNVRSAVRAVVTDGSIDFVEEAFTY